MRDDKVARIGSKAICVSLVLLISLTSVAVFLPSRVSADPIFPLTVYGYIYDSDGTTPVEGADVLITISSTGATRTDTTDALGRYDNIGNAFLTSEYEVGDTITIQAEKDTEMGSNTGIAEDGGPVQIDVIFTYEIPEFGSLIGTLVAMTAIALVSTVVMSRRRRA